MTELKEMSTIQRRLFGLIPRGDNQPMPITDLAAKLGTEPRYVNTLVYELVVNFGIPVCSYRDKPHNGVFIPLTDEQRAKGVVTQKEQAKSQYRKIRAIENADLNIVSEYEKHYPEVTKTSFLVPYTQTALDFEETASN